MANTERRRKAVADYTAELRRTDPQRFIELVPDDAGHWPIDSLNASSNGVDLTVCGVRRPSSDRLLI